MSGQSFPPGNVPATETPPSFAFNSRIMMAAIILLILVIIFILLLHVYARWFLQRSGLISHTRRPGIAFLSRSFTFEPHIASAPAHIDTGLDKATIAQLPTFVYKSSSPADNLEAGKLDESVAQQHPYHECAVCLSEFQENEEGRMLPSCKHTFHTECIDMWLFSHSTCPLCREQVVPAMANAQEAAHTHEQHHEGEEQEAMEASQGREGNSAVSNAVEYPYNVLVRVSPMDAVASQEPSSPSLRSSAGMLCARAVPQIAIDIPLLEGNVLVSASRPGPVCAKCITEDGAGSSQLLKSPGFRASFKRMLSRQSSRPKSFTQQEGYEVSPK